MSFDSFMLTDLKEIVEVTAFSHDVATGSIVNGRRS